MNLVHTVVASPVGAFVHDMCSTAIRLHSTRQQYVIRRVDTKGLHDVDAQDGEAVLAGLLHVDQAHSWVHPLYERNRLLADTVAALRIL